MDIIQDFVTGLKEAHPLEYIAVVAGIASVVFSRIENIWVYPTGLINTIIYTYLSFKAGLPGEASVNFYYTAMSLWGWFLWSRRNQQKEYILHITSSTKKEWSQHLLFFAVAYMILYWGIWLMNEHGLIKGAIPWADAFASATAYTGMWLMTKKKVESWYWWIATNIASIPLYFVKHFVVTSVYYIVLLVLAVFGLAEWKKRKQQI